MGETKEEISRFLWLTRLVVAGVVLFVGVIAIAQLIIFPNVVVKFSTGDGAQQLADVEVKKGGDLAELPVPLKPGSYFVGWSMTPDGEELITDLKNITANTTVYAVWDGVEKYAVLMANGVVKGNVNVFKASGDGVSASELNAKWVLEDDEFHYADNDGTSLMPITDNRGGEITVDCQNNYQKFLGWQYYNIDGRIEQLLYDNGNWTLRTADGQVSQITDENLFYPPNYRTTFNAILEYRKLELLFCNYGDNGEAVALPIAASNASNIYAPQYLKVGEANATKRFSHWEIIPGDLWQYAPQEIRDQIKITTFVPGERIVVDPLWYYLGSKAQFSADSNKDVVVTLVFRAQEWKDEKVDKYTMQFVSDVNSGVNKEPIQKVSSLTDLSLEQPIGYYNDALWLYKDPNQQITAYNFVDHEGVIHNIPTSILRDTYTQIKLGGGDGDQYTYTLGTEVKKVNFNTERAINISVNYRSASESIEVRYDYGSGLFVLPSYRYNESEIILFRSVRIGNVEILPNAERYLKNDWLFYGWQIKGDTSKKIYSAGESYTIPNSQSRVIEFEAVWLEARLLYEFDRDGGEWSSNPDFSMMKGAYGDFVQIVWDVPTKFGYNFVGWRLNGELRKPGDYIKVGEEINVLRAQWEPKKINIKYTYLIDEITRASRDGESGYEFGDTIKLLDIGSNRCYATEGWYVGDEIYLVNTWLELNYENVVHMNPQERNNQIYIELPAAQTVISTKIVYHAEFIGATQEYAWNIQSGWVNAITQGKRFVDYQPFSLSNSNLDMYGYEFTGWEYSVDGGQRDRIKATDTIPFKSKQIDVYAPYQAKSFVIEYRFQNQVYCKIHRVFETQPCESSYDFESYGASIQLLGENQIAPLPLEYPGWGQFVGWAFEPDHAAGNPEVVYSVLNRDEVSLRLSNVDDMLSTIYQVNVDQHAVKANISSSRLTYKLTLYAVYAQESVNITYEGLTGVLTSFDAPVFRGNDRSTSVMGGTTVGTESADFNTYGLAVLDESGLAISGGRSFVGWRIDALVDDPQSPAYDLASTLEERLWFPGDYLPAVNFDLRFSPVLINQNSPTVKVGEKEYRVVVLSAVDGQIPTQILSDVDIVVLPSGNYTVPTGAITINGAVQKVVVSANGAITLEPLAIRADHLKDFYVGDNVTVTGSPVIGANFQAYRVKKGYFTWDKDNRIISSVQGTQTYNADAAWQSLLVQGKTLLAVPSNTAIGAAGLRASLTDLGITCLVSYAITENNSLPQIDLSVNDLQLDAKAIFTSSAEKIILPASSNNVNSECISGYQYKLTTVVFGDAEATQANYALVENGFVYYGTDKGRIIYVLPSATTRGLDYNVSRDLLLDPAVQSINDYALSSYNRANGTPVNSITANAASQKNINLTNLIGMASVPKFVHADNPYISLSMIQTYEKVFYFNYGTQSGRVTYKYGQDFIVFDPKSDNSYGFVFDKPWHKFVGWHSDTGDFYYAGEVHRVGFDSKLQVDSIIEFNADLSNSWEAYPVRFHVYDPKSGTDVEANIPIFRGDYNRKYTLEQIVNNPNLLSQLYLPGMDLSFTTADGTKYQFVGWGSRSSAPTSLQDHLWDNNTTGRILPNRAANTKLNVGIKLGESYNYYALYDKVTDNLTYTLDGNGYRVSYNGNGKLTNVYIPYAKYNSETGFMVPVMKIAKNAFANIDNININKIIIGSAVTEIGDGAFRNVNAEIKFQHKGQNIAFHFPDGAVGGVQQSLSLKIGNDAFRENTKVQTITLPAAVSEIGGSAFRDCTNLTYFYLEELTRGNPLLTRLGDFVFDGDTAMRTNQIVQLILNDTNKKSFDDIGEGVFRNTNLQLADPTQNIIWGGVLLHACGVSGDVVFDTQITEIYGYAFANISGITSIKITNPSVLIKPRSFANLDSSVAQIDLTKVKIGNVYDGAFDTISSNVTVKVTSIRSWESRFPNVNFKIG